ncbi:MAG: cell division protein ZapA [Gammaproteobacteria bacterium]|nr:cell division protein ZapA [Gammaproteobacteria bacterium]
MNGRAQPVNITIFDKDYTVGCAEDERESLRRAVEFLNRKMVELRDGGKVIGSEQIAVMAALNIAHEYLDYRQRHERDAVEMDNGLRRIQDKIANALQRGRQWTIADLNPV